MEFLEKIKDKMFFMNFTQNSITLTEYSKGLENKDIFDCPIPNFYSIVKIGNLFPDFIEIITIDINSGSVIEKCFYSKSSIKSVWIDYE